MLMKCASPICRRDFDTWEHTPFKVRWCSRDCYLSDLDQHLEAKWEAEMEGRMIEDDPKENR
jgi:hypothetical protein